MTEQYANNADNQLAVDIGTGDTTLTVLNASSFPATPFRITVDNEVMFVTAVSGTTLTITRAQESTTAAIHHAGVVVRHALTAGSIASIVGQLASSGSFTANDSLPAPAKAGRNAFTTGALLYRDNGTGYDAFFPAINVNKPVLSNFTFFNPSNAFAFESHGAVTISAPIGSNSTFNLNILEMALPSAPYTVTAGLIPTQSISPHALYGICVRDSVGGKIEAIRAAMDSDNFGVQMEVFTSPTNQNGTPYNAQYNQYIGMGGITWMRIQDDGTNRMFFMGPTPWGMIQFYSETNTTYLTPNRAGFYINPYSQPTTVQAIHFLID